MEKASRYTMETAALNNSPQLAVALQDAGDALAILGRLLLSHHESNGIEWGRAATLFEAAAARIRATHAPGSGVTMGSKLNPSKFEPEALPDEPYFKLLGRDESAPAIVEAWAQERANVVARGERPSDDNNKVVEAYALAIAMREWRAERFAAWRPEALPEGVVE